MKPAETNGAFRDRICTTIKDLYESGGVTYVAVGFEASAAAIARAGGGSVIPAALHGQGMVIYKHAQRFNSIRQKLSPCHLEVMGGTAAQSKRYCEKDGDFFEHGELPMTVQEASKKGEILHMAFVYEFFKSHENELPFVDRTNPLNWGCAPSHWWYAFGMRGDEFNEEFEDLNMLDSDVDDDDMSIIDECSSPESKRIKYI
jgi:hypothetical protein